MLSFFHVTGNLSTARTRSVWQWRAGAFPLRDSFAARSGLFFSELIDPFCASVMVGGLISPPFTGRRWNRSYPFFFDFTSFSIFRGQSATRVAFASPVKTPYFLRPAFFYPPGPSGERPASDTPQTQVGRARSVFVLGEIGAHPFSMPQPFRLDRRMTVPQSLAMPPVPYLLVDIRAGKQKKPPTPIRLSPANSLWPSTAQGLPRWPATPSYQIPLPEGQPDRMDKFRGVPPRFFLFAAPKQSPTLQIFCGWNRPPRLQQHTVHVVPIGEQPLPPTEIWSLTCEAFHFAHPGRFRQLLAGWGRPHARSGEPTRGEKSQGGRPTRAPSRVFLAPPQLQVRGENTDAH